MNKGALCAVGAYLLWGFLPIYWKALEEVPAVEILAHRILWSFVAFAAYFAFTQRWTWLKTLLRDRKQMAVIGLAALFIGINWGIYIWGVTTGRVVETSLGYFITPLVSVLLGVVALGERLRVLQWAAVALAGAGVSYLSLRHGAIPWVALALACSFGLYGLLKNRTSIGAMRGMLVETSVVALPAFAYLLWKQGAGEAAFLQAAPSTSLLLFLSGLATALPLVLFAAAAKRVSLATLGLLQYLNPTVQFLIGTQFYGEPFGRDRVIGFGIIWLALAVFTGERLLRGRRRRLQPPLI